MTTEAVRAIYLRRADGALSSQMTDLHMAGNVEPCHAPRGVWRVLAVVLFGFGYLGL